MSPTLAPFVTLTGANSHVTERRCVRLTTQEAWAALWLEHLGLPAQAPYDLYYNEAGLPVVDFDRCMVIAVFDGATMNSAGYAAAPVPVTQAAHAAAANGDPSGHAGSTAPVEGNAGDAVLRIVAHSYQTLGPDGGGVAATPFAFFIVPRTLAPLIVQEREGRMNPAEAESVIERARFPALPPALPAEPAKAR